MQIIMAEGFEPHIRDIQILKSGSVELTFYHPNFKI
jgi:hypothetical protein